MVEEYQTCGLRLGEEALLVVSLVPAGETVLTPAHFDTMPYMAAILLPVALDAAIAEDSEYRAGCQAGFESYFAEMHQWDETVTRYVFVNRYYTAAQIKRRVRLELLDSDANGWEPELLPWRTGFVHGWLSALSLTDRELALYGMDVLLALLKRKFSVGNGKPCVRR
jgi:hypothetical protein